jgi:predicted RNA-binding protein with PIN domain
MLETVVPIMQHVDKSDEEADSFIERMFEHYKSTKEESVGRYTKGETEVPLSKQAGRLDV